MFSWLNCWTLQIWLVSVQVSRSWYQPILRRSDEVGWLEEHFPSFGSNKLKFSLNSYFLKNYVLGNSNGKIWLLRENPKGIWCFPSRLANHPRKTAKSWSDRVLQVLPLIGPKWIGPKSFRIMAGVQRFLPCKREQLFWKKQGGDGRWLVMGSTLAEHIGWKWMKYGEDRNDTLKSKKRNLHNIAYHS